MIRTFLSLSNRNTYSIEYPGGTQWIKHSPSGVMEIIPLDHPVTEDAMLSTELNTGFIEVVNDDPKVS